MIYYIKKEIDAATLREALDKETVAEIIEIYIKPEQDKPKVDGIGFEVPSESPVLPSGMEV